MLENELTKNIIVLDTETTGLDPYTDELLQLAIIDGDGNTLYNSYFRPVHTQSWSDVQSIHGITPEMVSCSPTVGEELSKIQKIISGAEVVVGYNPWFDMRFLMQAGICFDHLSDPNYCNGYPGWHTVDLMEFFAAIYGDWNTFHGSYTWQKLTVAAAHYGYEWGSGAVHDALADCRATLYIAKAMLAKGDLQLAEQRIIEANAKLISERVWK